MCSIIEDFAKQMLSSLEESSVTDKEKRWIVVGSCLLNVLTPALRNVLGTEIPKWYQFLCQPPTEIDKQVFGSHKRQLTPSTLNLNYKSINNNYVHKSPRAYDYRVKDPLSLAKLFVRPFMSNFTGFDETMDLHAVLSVICEAAPFTGAGVHAKTVRSDVRNEWAHCNIASWTEAKFLTSIENMETLLKNLSLSLKSFELSEKSLNEEEFRVVETLVENMKLPSKKKQKLLDDLSRWKDKETLLQRMATLVKNMKKEEQEEWCESMKLWEWKKSSKIHRETFTKLLKYGQEHPNEVEEVGRVYICRNEEFLIGKGIDGTRVYVGLGKDGFERAVKCLPEDTCTSLAEQEMKALTQPNTAKSNNVIRYWFFESDKRNVFLILDLCEETLKNYVDRESLDNLLTSATKIIRQVLIGLADLHRGPNPILHRDLKPSNILRDVHGTWLLADFGISRILNADETTHKSEQRGTRHWRAVETYPAKGTNDDAQVCYKKESDIQVAGMVAYYIVTKGKHPFGEEDVRLSNLRNGEPVGLDKLKDPALKNLLTWMLSHNPKDRPSAEEALKHPYLQTKEQQFELLCNMGNQPEVQTGDKTSNVVQQLNSCPTYWKTVMDVDVQNYLCTDLSSGRPKRYDSSWTACLRLIRNVKQHWNDTRRPKPPPPALNLAGNPQEYFLQIFPHLPVDVHRIVRSCDWKERPELQKYFK